MFKHAPKKETFYASCERAGIAYKPDAQGRSVNRHSLRTTFITWLSAADVSPRTAQKLAGHSDLKLTMQTYTDPQVLDTLSAIERLPELHPEWYVQQQQATGTYDEGVVPSVIVNLHEEHRNAMNGEKTIEAENAVSVCDATTCASVLNTSLGRKKVGPGRGNRGHWRAIAGSGTHGPGRGEPGP
ncbi:MAG: tyrosine-type recombinase/integrase [Phycisphaerae bacterium]